MQAAAPLPCGGRRFMRFRHRRLCPCPKPGSPGARCEAHREDARQAPHSRTKARAKSLRGRLARKACAEGLRGRLARKNREQSAEPVSQGQFRRARFAEPDSQGRVHRAGFTRPVSTRRPRPSTPSQAHAGRACAGTLMRAGVANPIRAGAAASRGGTKALRAALKREELPLLPGPQLKMFQGEGASGMNPRSWASRSKGSRAMHSISRFTGSERSTMLSVVP